MVDDMTLDFYLLKGHGVVYGSAPKTPWAKKSVFPIKPTDSGFFYRKKEVHVNLTTSREVIRF